MKIYKLSCKKKMPTNELFDIFIYVNILVLFCRSYHE